MTDREIRGPADLDAIDFAKGDGLVPVVVQDLTGLVRMVAYQNRTALEATLETGRLHLWSRSRDALWMKGETSGDVHPVSSLHADCDGDAVLARVDPEGPTCHTGEATCFGHGVGPRPVRSTPNDRGSGARDPLTALDATLASRAAERPEGSYTVRLLDDENLRLKKLGEESSELVAALAKGDAGRAVEEAADLLYHVAVGLRAEGVGLDALLSELARRAG